MSSTSEKGHAKNVANFETLIEYLVSYGSDYQPTKSTLKLDALQILLKKAKENMDEVGTITIEFNNTTNERAIQFEALPKLCTRIINAFKSSDANEKKVEDARAFVRKIQGGSTAKAPKAKNADEPIPETISTSQRSYDQKTEHLSGLMKTLKSEKSYAPNEADLTVKNLEGMLDSFRSSTKDLNKAMVNIKKARTARNKTLYTKSSGLYDVADDVKTYVKSVYGPSAIEYKQLVKLKFSNSF